MKYFCSRVGISKRQLVAVKKNIQKRRGRLKLPKFLSLVKFLIFSCVKNENYEKLKL